MKPVLASADSLRDLFSAMVESTFQVELGVADPQLTDYLAEMLIRFVQTDAIFRVRDTTGKRLEEVAEMLMEAEQREAKPQREIYRHIGDFTLFWAGVYPEALSRLQSSSKKDHLIDYCQQGKRSYYLASQFNDEPYRREAPVLRRLSMEFEMCSFGLNRVRREWEKLPASQAEALWNAEQN
jgi:hypothetical protein